VISDLAANSYVHHLETCGVKEIGQHLGVTSATVRQNVDSLVEQALIARSEEAEDRQMQCVESMDRGHKVFGQRLKAHGCWTNFVADQLSQEKKEAVTPSLSILTSRDGQLDHGAVSLK
jgi:DNA-binding MarR family transcriptional regulator